jgi:hypothetical protein
VIIGFVFNLFRECLGDVAKFKAVLVLEETFNLPEFEGCFFFMDAVRHRCKRIVARTSIDCRGSGQTAY